MGQIDDHATIRNGQIVLAIVAAGDFTRAAQPNYAAQRLFSDALQSRGHVFESRSRGMGRGSAPQR
jgi:hypothetical protein